VITGYNTDVEHDGVIYHVQTEDKGLDSPLILSLVYSGGAILAAKRSPYKDLLASGFSEAALAERLKRQHRLICAAIHSGRLEDLKRMGSQTGTISNPSVNIEAEETPTRDTAPPEIEYSPLVPQYEPVPSEVKKATKGKAPKHGRPEPQPPTDEAPPPEFESLSSEPQSLAAGEETLTEDSLDSEGAVGSDRRDSPLGDLPIADQGLVVNLVNEQEFRSGEALTVRVLVTQRSSNADKPLNNVAISLKVLGTTFRPQIYSTKTQRNGMATIDVQIPQFTSGRAAILVRAVAHGQSTEIRRIVQTGK